MAARQLFCTFFLDDFCFGIEVEKVQEIIRQQDVTRVPLASPVIEGLINLRGNIVTAIDLRRRLGLPQRPADQRPMSFVLQTGSGLASLVVDRIGDVLEVEDSAFERPPETLRGPARELIRGAYKLDERLLLVLETEEVVKVPA
jgi:purine-binding chemotaxis protein CheW